MPGQPEELSTKLLSTLGRIASDGAGDNKSILNKLKEDAALLQKTNAGLAFVVFAGVAYFEHRTEDMLRFHEKSLRNSAHDFHVNANYAVSLSNTGRYLEAVTYARRALEIVGHSDIECLKDVINYCRSAGLLIEASSYIEKLQAMNIENDNLEAINASVTLLTDFDLSEDQLQSYYCLSTEILTKHDIYIDGDFAWILEDDDGIKVVREIYIDVSPDKAARMNVELSQLVANKALPVDLLMAFSCSFTAGKVSEYQ